MSPDAGMAQISRVMESAENKKRIERRLTVDLEFDSVLNGTSGYQKVL